MARAESGQTSNHAQNELSDRDIKDIEDRLRLRSTIVFEIVREEGDEELSRPLRSLWWSGVAAGLSIGFSVVAEGLLRAGLPDTAWRPLIDNLGYSVGFLIVILARQQLFTENTLTAVLPVLDSPSWSSFVCMLRLWAIVFAANMVGAMVFAYALSSDVFFSDSASAAFREIAEHLVVPGGFEIMMRGILAGWIIATLVWLMPSAVNSQVILIVLLTYLIALADLSHVIAGSVEVFLLAFDGTLAWSAAVFGFILPALIGNVIGGSALFALISYAQVRAEL